jgi:hypothetical protein
VEFDKKQLAITAAFFVPESIDRMLQIFLDEPISELFGPYKASDMRIRTTKCRSMAYIPFDLTGSLLGADVAAPQTYELIVQVLVEAGTAALCTPSVNSWP